MLPRPCARPLISSGTASAQRRLPIIVPPLDLPNSMSTSVFKGAIGAGTISAHFAAASGNSGSALLFISFAEMGGANPVVDQGAAVPGGFANVSLSPAKNGPLEVWVDCGQATDEGRLTVSLNGTEVDADDTLGSVRWIYSVEA